MFSDSRDVKRWIIWVLVTLVAVKTISVDDSWLNSMLQLDTVSSFAVGTTTRRVDEVESALQQQPPPSQRLELPELAGSHQANQTCPPNLVLYTDTVLDDETVFENRKIPRIVHFTSKSRCLSQSFAENLQKWHFPNHSVYLHDDEAVARLLQRHWPQFPDLEIGASCLLSGAAKADLWRGVILYEYGGIYSDIDNYPNEFNGTTIQPDDEAFFVVESVGVMSQWFFAARPKHPLMYLLVETTLHMLIKLDHVDKQHVPSTTGPGAVKIAMMHFMDSVRLLKPELHATPHEKFQRVKAGIYTGLENATVRVVGHRANQKQFVCRTCVTEKRQGYAAMHMKHFSQIKPRTNFESCIMRIYRMHERDTDLEDW